MRLEGLNENATFKEKLRYVFEQIKTHGRNLYWWEDRFMVYIGRHIVNKYWIRRYPKEKIVSVMQEDWDNLIILDACRYDTFIEVYGEKCDYRISKGSSTPEFLKNNFNFNKKSYKNIIYITANPWVDKICKKTFYKIISVWRYEWNEKLGTVHPKEVMKYAIQTEDNFPDKKLIIHFLQPHWWYISYPELVKKVAKEHPKGIIVGSPWPLIREGSVSLEDIYRAYNKDLKLVLHYALKLSKKLQGKTVITADHGEAFGEFAFPLPIRVYGHPSGLYIPALVKVPWLVIDKGKRKEIRTEGEKERVKNVVRKLKYKL